jgi:hypothetical protein
MEGTSPAFGSAIRADGDYQELMFATEAACVHLSSTETWAAFHDKSMPGLVK